MINNSRVKFDAIAFRGLSGALVAPSIAIMMNKHLLAVRKTGDTDHSKYRVEGYMGCPYIIVDDLIESGETMETIIDAVGSFPEAIFLWNTSKETPFNYQAKDIAVFSTGFKGA